MENPVPEPRAERIARYKAERRRELAERHGGVEELPTKWVRREEGEARGPEGRARGASLGSDGERVNGGNGGVSNGEAEPR